ncbi:hypothetical protein DF3PB_4100001 [uncultured Defluviicoccus sp.]|uniref:Uncharacterized protein n=1 Tax=metagenome TaxID=256318 RepID=A0A380TFR1_9ZZZZ|nr:hypothetical protein DF3PB_4100001 [uncultured Defluviicoccus sp.]
MPPAPRVRRGGRRGASGYSRAPTTVHAFFATGFIEPPPLLFPPQPVRGDDPGAANVSYSRL